MSEDRKSRRALSEAPQSRRGCLFWGSIAFLIVASVAIGAVGLGFLVYIRPLRDFSSSEPLDEERMRIPEPSSDELHEARETIDRLQKEPAAPEREIVRITTRQLNALIAGTPEARDHGLPGHIRFLPGEGDSLLVDVSWPLDAFPGLSERYFSGRIRVGLEFHAKRKEVSVRVVEGTSRDGKKLVERFRRPAGKLLTTYLNEALGASLERLEDLEVEDGTITLTLGPSGSDLEE